MRILCVAACVLVPLSRMYLGVHTPADVAVSIAVALALVFGLYPLVYKSTEKPGTMRILFAAMLAVSAAFLIFVEVFPFPENIDLHNLESGHKTAYKMLGCILGLWLAFEMDERFIHFDTKAVWWAQLLKLAIGAIPLLAIKSGLKAPLNALCGGAYFADGIRYFLMVAVAGGLWPMTFPLFAKLGKKTKAKAEA